jgi:TolA-binding protein
MGSGSRLGWITTATLLIACGAGEQPPQAPVEDQQALVIPPIGADAGSGIASEPMREPADARGSVQLMASRDPRLAKRRPRSRALVLTEVSGLERLLDTTAKTAPDRPLLRRRIAESYNELASTSSGADASRARDESIKHYAALKNDYPNYASIDEVLYYLGIAYELNGDKTNARKSYYEVIQKAPSSKLVPLAYFAFGEMFFAESVMDPSKNDLAKQAFIEVMKYPSSENPVYADTLLRLGQTYLRSKDDAKAKTMFDRLQRDFPDSSAAAQVPQDLKLP